MKPNKPKVYDYIPPYVPRKPIISGLELVVIVVFLIAMAVGWDFIHRPGHIAGPPAQHPPLDAR